jgi:hypothetical protein
MFDGICYQRKFLLYKNSDKIILFILILQQYLNAGLYFIADAVSVGKPVKKIFSLKLFFFEG